MKKTCLIFILLFYGFAFTAAGVPTAVATQLERLGNPIDVAYAALWLCSDEAAWVTGLELTIDGGDSLFIDSPIRREVLA